MPQRRFQPNLSASRDRRAGANPVVSAPARNRTVDAPEDGSKSSNSCVSGDELSCLPVQSVDPLPDKPQTSSGVEQPSLVENNPSPVLEATEQSQVQNGDSAHVEEAPKASNPKKGQWVRRKVAPKVTPAGERRAKRRQNNGVLEKEPSGAIPADAGQVLANGERNVPSGLAGTDVTTHVPLEPSPSANPPMDTVPEMDMSESTTALETCSAGVEDTPGLDGLINSPVLTESCPLPDGNELATPEPVAMSSPEKARRGSGGKRSGGKGSTRQRANSSRASQTSGQGTGGRKRPRKEGTAADKEAQSTQAMVSGGAGDELADHGEDCNDLESGPPLKKKAVSKKRKASEVATARLQQFRDAPDRSSMTMQQLIYYNPSSNPMKQSERRKKVAATESERSRTSSPRSTDHHEENGAAVNGGSPGEVDDRGSGRLVPKLKIAADGSIEVDADSMLMDSASASFLEETRNSQAVVEDDDYTTSTSFRAKHRSKKWTETETGSFYEALMKVGTDFTMMTLLLPKRTRKELKNKFKKEEKSNPTRVTKAMERLCSKSSS